MVPRVAKLPESPASAVYCPLTTLPELFKAASEKSNHMPALKVLTYVFHA